jgi:murein DD-endopeptidase MepM/ murein hydrolase activator NlpD
MHYGVDFAAPKGTPIKAVASGTISTITNSNKGFGKCVLIKHNNNIVTRYAHLSKILVHEGQIVDTEKIIGLVGSTGNTRGKNDPSHLHLELFIDGVRYNPLPHLIW